ncbi:MAG: aldo/keto reductase [Alkalibacterium gilvum]|uniref:aldo/keto reductase n=1 Tax=Alkalibacterium TaxID=99906 RepID=UPI00264A1979|nr:aldo/keto reductase [Alkalibacterium sp.]MDN6194355.1 aldo/keto reductase [Alkalibacterium sp.]MDN6294234.1 aldo/keto reductase [Alkalibacterium sp.]MDN6295790.1 aldo/keto reductase [Alkalibacterium sp.]MDN6398644.1 aldo/keto reductase [Alkalibacterium sp.]
MMDKETFTFNNGVSIPSIGFGTWQIPNEEAYDSVTMALKNGYTHIDTALAYKNEENVGKAIHDFDVKREDIFITSKLPANIKGYDETLEAFNKTMTHLGVDYLDLYLIHAPWPWDDIGKECTEGNIQSWKAMEALYKEGKIKAIGVSNFEIEHLKPILDNCEIVPLANQIPFYIGRDQEDLLAFCKDHNILVEAYSPLATGDVLQLPELKEMAEKYDVTVAQLAIRYCLEKDTLPLPKSTHEKRIIENRQLDFKLSKEDVTKLDKISDVRK